LEQGTIPEYNNPTRSTYRGQEFKFIESFWSKFPDKLNVKVFSLSFLDADNITAALINLTGNGKPFLFRIYISNVPIHNFSYSVASKIATTKCNSQLFETLSDRLFYLCSCFVGGGCLQTSRL
jgi:hypothetical protein